MKSKIFTLLFSVFCLIAYSSYLNSITSLDSQIDDYLYGLNLEPLKTKNSQEELSKILEKTGDYCEKVKKMALFYVCKEKIVKKRYFYKTETYRKKLLNVDAWEWKIRLKVKGTKKNTYTYDYQLIKKGDELKERRILLEEDGKKKLEENAELKMVKYASKYLVYGPVGFMSKYWQDYFDYEIVGKDTVEGKEAIILNSFPISVMEENDNYGRVWVDDRDFNILKIEWDPKSIKDYEEEIIPSSMGDLKKKMFWSVSYGIEKNGVRFPSKQVIQEFLINEEGEKFIHQETLFNYVDYKFFKVEVDVKYRPPNFFKRKGFCKVKHSYLSLFHLLLDISNLEHRCCLFSTSS